MVKFFKVTCKLITSQRPIVIKSKAFRQMKVNTERQVEKKGKINVPSMINLKINIYENFGETLEENI